MRLRIGTRIGPGAEAGSFAPGSLPVAGCMLLAVLLLAEEVQGQAAPRTPPDTVQVDSTRLRVMESLQRINRQPTAPAEGLRMDPDAAFQAGVSAAQRARDARARAEAARSPMSEGADPIMEALLELPGFAGARYQGERAEFMTGEGRLILLSPAGARGRSGIPADSLFPDTTRMAYPDSLPVAPDSVLPLPPGVLDPARPPSRDATVIRARAGEEGEAPATPARLIFDGRQIEADTAILYHERTGRVSTVGRTVTQDREGDPLESRTLIYDLNEERGSALGARTRYSEGGGEWFVFGDANSLRPGEAWLHDAMFTSCDLEEPHSHFSVGQIKILNGNVLVARPVVLYFADVPVAWLPFIAQGLGTGRQSGLLTPRFSVNDIVRSSGGYARRLSNVGFYWAMSDYSDASLAMDWYSGNFTALTGNVRYSWARQFLNGDIAYRQYWPEGGGRQLAFDTRHRWEIDERTRVDVSGRYTSDAGFVRQNSFDPREVTQSIDSNAGFSRRFDFGNLSLSARRRQYLTDDRVETTLPSANLSLSPITFFGAPPVRASFYHNVTWTGGASFNRNLDDRPAQLDTFTVAGASRASTQARVSSSLSLGGLSLSQGASFSESVLRDVPGGFFLPPPGMNRFGAAFPSLQQGLQGLPSDQVDDLAQAELSWNSSVSYQQRLIGSTTVTPTLEISGRSVRSDSIPEAMSYVAAPARLSFGAGLRTDIYGFFPGFRGFDALRHKLSPSLDYRYAPAVTPDELQRRVFGSREVQARNTLSFRLNQTLEARARPREQDPAPGAEAPVAREEETAEAARDPEEAPGVDPDDPEAPQVAALPSELDAGADAPSRRERAEIVKLLGLQTSGVSYDFVLADSLGDWTQGFTTTRLSNQITSDYLRGLTLSIEHDLFEDTLVDPETRRVDRRFDPFLSQVGMGFALGSSSAIFRALGLFQGATEGTDEVREPDLDEEGLGDESSVIPGAGPRRTGAARFTGSTGTWSANFTYALRRPRDGAIPPSQMVSGNFRFRPTPNWDVSWQTSYDLEFGGFNDHIISLTRDLHEWEATFDFLQTATGNWSFRFNVALVANRDLKFDYQQRSLREDTFFR